MLYYANYRFGLSGQLPLDLIWMNLILEKKWKNYLGKIRVKFEIVLGIFRSVFRNSGFIIIKVETNFV